MITIAGRPIGPKHPPFIIAEVSGNHKGSLDRAMQLIDAAAEAGADAVKFQTFTADGMTLDVDGPDFIVGEANALWAGRTLHDLYAEAHTPWEWHEQLFAHARERDIIPLSSPFHEDAVDLLEGLEAPAYKIASLENNHRPLLRKVAATRKPVIVSTGASTLEDIERSVTWLREFGCEDLVLLKCTTAYPAKPADANLHTLRDLAERFDCTVGLSDHTLGTAVSVAATALGANVIEKHITLSRTDGAVDSAFSLEPEDLKELVHSTRDAHAALGAVQYSSGKADDANRAFRRSIYVSADASKGDTITEENVRVVRPGHGLPPSEWDKILGRTFSQDVSKGTRLDWNLIE